MKSILGRLFPRFSSPSIGEQLAMWRESLVVENMAPYDLDLYTGFLAAIAGQTGAIWRKFEAAAEPEAANWWHRHDIDTLACLRNIPRLLEIDVRHSCPSAVFFRPEDEVDGYDWKDAAAIVRQFRGQGIDFGLHTMCYTYADPWVRLKEELARFSSAFGGGATYLTFHGLGKVRAETRARVQRDMPARMQELGIAFSDCDQSLRSYHHVVEDCHLVDGVRAAKSDFRTPPKALIGARFLLLTHPCYWKV
jgi:hypothetical protein